MNFSVKIVGSFYVIFIIFRKVSGFCFFTKFVEYIVIYFLIYLFGVYILGC